MNLSYLFKLDSLVFSVPAFLIYALIDGVIIGGN